MSDSPKPAEPRGDRKTLRDHFAGLAMQALTKTPGSFEWYASEAYRLADAMLKAREETP